MVCWYCHWGWPEQVVQIYKVGVEKAGRSAMRFGAGHIVWEDENFDSESIEWCIQDAAKHPPADADEREAMAAVVQSLKQLLALPGAVRCCCPADYDGAHPEKYPPRPGLVMVHAT